MGARELSEIIQKATLDLERFNAKSALVGGLAVSVRTRPRMTKDVDFSVAVQGDGEAEQLLRNFLTAGYRLGPLLEHKTTGRLATARLFVPDSQGTEPDVDLLFASCGIENEIVAAATQTTFPSIGLLPIAQCGHLIAMKVLAESDMREHDRSDLHALIAASTKHDRELAKTSCQLILERGYAREKDLLAALAGFTRRWKGSRPNSA